MATPPRPSGALYAPNESCSRGCAVGRAATTAASAEGGRRREARGRGGRCVRPQGHPGSLLFRWMPNATSSPSLMSHLLSCRPCPSSRGTAAHISCRACTARLPACISPSVRNTPTTKTPNTAPPRPCPRHSELLPGSKSHAHTHSAPPSTLCSFNLHAWTLKPPPPLPLHATHGHDTPDTRRTRPIQNSRPRPCSTTRPVVQGPAEAGQDAGGRQGPQAGL